ncbi:serine hydrolase [bacterium]|nr:serine hydrolase [bacterium]
MNRRTVAKGAAASMAALIGCAPSGAPQQAAPGGLEGVWSARLGGDDGLRLKLVITAAGEATLFSIDQGNEAIPAKLTSADARRVVVDVSVVGGRFEGALEGDEIKGVWRQGASQPLVFVRGEALLADPAPPPPLTQARLGEIRSDAGSPAMIAASRDRAGADRLFVGGVRDADRPEPATATDPWHIGSCTKSITATLVARLVDAGSVGWDDTVGDLLADVAPDMGEAYRPVTFRHLLSHRSGLNANIGIVDFLRFKRINPDPREERRQFARKALAQAPAGAAETHFEYSNTGYVIAGAMLEARLGEAWETLVRRHVFEPLAMASAGFGPPGTEAGETPRKGASLEAPVGHSKAMLGQRRKPHRPGSGVTDNPAVLGPAGTAHATAADMLTYLAAHRDRDEAFLRPESWSTLHTPPFGGEYAMGWIVRKDGSLWHNGSNTLWYAEMAFHAEAGRAAFVCANDGHLPLSQPAVGRALAAMMV